MSMASLYEAGLPLESQGSQAVSGISKPIFAMKKEVARTSFWVDCGALYCSACRADSAPSTSVIDAINAIALNAASCTLGDAAAQASAATRIS